MIFDIDSTMKHSYSNDDTCFSIDIILEEDFDSLQDEGSKILYSIKGTLRKEEIFSEFDKFMAMAADENFESESDTEELPFDPWVSPIHCVPKKGGNIVVTNKNDELVPTRTVIESIEVFMDDFSIFGDSFDKCLNNLDKLFQCCRDAHLVLNWEKCHFIVKEGIVLGHKVSSAGLEVDKTKIDVISKLPFPTNIKLTSKVGSIFKRTSLTRFPAQSISSSNAIALDSPDLLVLITGMSQSRQHGKSESDSYYLSD
uniref:Retrovirus-related Pol polyprotein n=1 Tax=Tanacetum cinerariifolium TaxID=118510 RepID=A0A6L2J7N3_TANCI|nr:retrovirus-related Pol polyprotein [Tanacetum cinerariifolium]